MYFNDASLQEWNKPSKKYAEVKQKDDDASLIFTDEMLKTKEDKFERKM
jgi:hypothetical protein